MTYKLGFKTNKKPKKTNVKLPKAQKIYIKQEYNINREV